MIAKMFMGLVQSTEEAPPSEQLNAPGTFMAYAIDASQINLQWKDTNTSEPTRKGFEIQRASASDFSDAVTIDNIKIIRTGCFSLGLAPLTTYHFRVRALGATADQNSDWITVSCTTRATTAVGPLRIKQYQDHSQGYGAWSKSFEHFISGVYRLSYGYSAVSHHYGRSNFCLLELDQNFNFVAERVLLEDPIARASSWRDIGGGVVPSTGTIIGTYVKNHVVQEDPDDPQHDNEDQAPGQFQGIGHLRSTDHFATFTNFPASMPVGFNDAYSDCGNLDQHPTTGRIFKSNYGTHPLQRLLIVVSDDDGLTFTLLAAFPLINSDSENCIKIVDPGTGNSDCVLAVACRNDIDKMDMYILSDGGTTMLNGEQIPWVTTKGKPPIFIDKPGDPTRLLMTWSDRSAYDYLVYACEFDKSILATAAPGFTTAALIKRMVVTESAINSLIFHSDNSPAQFGYPDFACPPLKPKGILWYDLSAYTIKPGVDGHDIAVVDQFVIQFDEDVFVKTRQEVSSVTYGNGVDMLLSQTAASTDTHGGFVGGSNSGSGWVPGNGSRYKCYKAGLHDVQINLPISNGDGGTKTLNVYKNGNPTPVYSIVETDGLLSAVGKLQGGFQATLALNDTLDFLLTITGATGSVFMPAGTTVLYGMLYGIDIMCVSAAIPDPIEVRVQATSQHFANGIATQIGGIEVLDDRGIWDPTTNMLSIPKTCILEFEVDMILPNAPGGRRIFDVHNYSRGMENQTAIFRVHHHLEDKARGGTNTETKFKFRQKVYAGEYMKFWLTAYGADIDSVAGSHYSIKIIEV